MAQKAIIELRNEKIRQQGNYQVRAKPRPDLAISIRKQAKLLLEKRRITSRDIDIARALLGVGLLTRHQMQRLFFNDNAGVASNRLVRLYRYHFLDRGHYWLAEMGEMGLDPCYIYALGSVGQELFAIYNGLRRQDLPVTADDYSLMRSNHFLLHDLQISEMFTRLQIAANGASRRMIWYNQAAAALHHGEKEIVRPDGMATLYADDGSRRDHYFIEMDRGHTDWKEKLDAYDYGLRWCTWQQQLSVKTYPVVLCVTPPGQGAHLAEVVRVHRPQTRILIKEWPAFMRDDVLTGWWDALPLDGDASEVHLLHES